MCISRYESSTIFLPIVSTVDNQYNMNKNEYLHLSIISIYSNDVYFTLITPNK